MSVNKLTTTQVRVEAWAQQNEVKKLGDLTAQQVDQAARELSLPPDVIQQTVNELQKTQFGDAASQKRERLLQGDLSAAAVEPHVQRDVFGGAETPAPSRALQAFEQLVSLQNDRVQYRQWDRATIHDAQSTVRNVFKRDLTAPEQREARLWMAAGGGGWALDAVTKSSVQHFLNGVWSKLFSIDYAKAPGGG